MFKIFATFFLFVSGSVYSYADTSALESSLNGEHEPSVIYYETKADLIEALCSAEITPSNENPLEQSATADWPVHVAEGPGQLPWRIYVAQGPGQLPWRIYVAQGPGHQCWYLYADIRPSGPMADWPVHVATGPGHQGWYLHAAEGFWLKSPKQEDWYPLKALTPEDKERICNSFQIAGPTVLISGPTFM